jgi:hypothetical protein
VSKSFNIKEWQNKYLNEAASSSDWKKAIKLLQNDLKSGTGEAMLAFTFKDDMQDEYGDDVFVLQGYKSGKVEAFSKGGAKYHFKEKELVKNLNGVAVEDGNSKTLFKKGDIK